MNVADIFHMCVFTHGVKRNDIIMLFKRHNLPSAQVKKHQSACDTRFVSSVHKSIDMLDVFEKHAAHALFSPNEIHKLRKKLRVFRDRATRDVVSSADKTRFKAFRQCLYRMIEVYPAMKNIIVEEIEQLQQERVDRAEMFILSFT